MKPVFKTLPEFQVIGVSGKFISVMSPDKNNLEVIPKLWGNFFKEQAKITTRKNPINLGLCWMPGPGDIVDHPFECFYMACTEVTNIEKIPEGLELKTIPAGEFAVFTHKGTLDSYQQTLGNIFGLWLPASGKNLRNCPQFEYYDERFKLNSKDSEVDIYIPVV